MKCAKTLYLLPFLALFAGCNAGDVVANLPGLSGVLDSAIWSVLGPLVVTVALAIWKLVPRALIVPLDGALGALIAALAAVADDLPNKGWPAVVGIMVAVAMRGFLKFIGDIKAMLLAWANGAPLPMAGDVKVYVPKDTQATGSGTAVAATGKKVAVTGFSPWAGK